jgi:phosphoribosyl 1,2-cyclic phosphate phosphodiesterase
MPLRFTILGCGSSAGVPRVGQGWGACDPNNPKNRRRRCSLLIERKADSGSTIALVDTSPDLREQLLSTDVRKLDGVLYTHDHADHSHGIDDVRPIVLHQRKRVDVYLDATTSAALHEKFAYCFATPPGSDYPPIVTEHRIAAGAVVKIDGEGGSIITTPYVQNHGSGTTLGFRFGRLAYSCDVSAIPDASLPQLEDLDVWILDALRYKPHPSHFSVDEALAWVERMRPRRAILTNLHTDLDYETLRRALPENVEPAFDGMYVELPSERN